MDALTYQWEVLANVQARCDISTSLATGKPHLFFRDPSYEPNFSIHLDKEQADFKQSAPFFADNGLPVIWSMMQRFSAKVNDAAIRQAHVSDTEMLKVMASAMYRLLRSPAHSSVAEEAARLALLSFGATVFLHWKDLRLPLPWLQSELHLKIECLVESLSFASTHPTAMLWLIGTYTVAFWPLVETDKLKFLRWMKQLARQCGCLSWQSYERSMQSFLWIDVLFRDKVRQVFNEAMSLG